MSTNFRYLVVLSLLFVAALGQSNDIKPTKLVKEEAVERDTKLSVTVNIIENEKGANGATKTEVKVHLNVDIEEDVVKVNGKMTELDVLTRYELDADVEYSGQEIRRVPVVVHVLVIKNVTKEGYMFLLEEQVKVVEQKTVEQVEVRLLTIHVHQDGREYSRTVGMVAFERSHMRHKTLSKTCGRDDHSPRKIYREPRLPDEKGWTFHKHHGKSLCSKFHDLPFVWRVTILIGVIFFLLISVMCCAVFCCRKPKSSVYTINDDDSFKADFETEEEAEPLPEKLSFDDKQVLIA